jgi:hypothetical protein
MLRGLAIGAATLAGTACISFGAITFSNFQISGSLVGGSLPNAIVVVGAEDVDITFDFPAATVGDPVHPQRAGNIVITFHVDSTEPLTADILSMLGGISGSGFVIFNEVVEDRSPGNEGIIASTSVIVDGNNPPPVGETIVFSRPSTALKIKKTLFMSAQDTQAFDLAQISLIEQRMVPTPGAVALITVAAGFFVARRRRT